MRVNTRKIEHTLIEYIYCSEEKFQTNGAVYDKDKSI